MVGRCSVSRMMFGCCSRPRPSPVHRLAEGGQQPLLGEARVQRRSAEEAGEVGAAGLGAAEAEDRLQLRLENPRVDLPGCLEEGAGLPRQRLEVDPAELGVGGGIARPAELGDEPVGPLEHNSVQRVDLLGEQLHARRLDRPPAPGVGFVRLLHRGHPVGDLGAVDVDHQLGLAGGDSRLLRRAGPPQVCADGELEQVPGAAPALAARRAVGLAQLVDRLAAEQIGTAGVDRLDVIGGRLAGEVKVVGEVELGEELARLGRVGVEVERHRAGTIGKCRKPEARRPPTPRRGRTPAPGRAEASCWSWRSRPWCSEAGGWPGRTATSSSSRALSRGTGSAPR